MTNFPGNPYAPHDRSQMEAPQGVYQAIMTLAFEVRTANQLAHLQSIGKNLDGMSENATLEWIGRAREIDERMGHSQ